MFALLDNKLMTKELFRYLEIPTPNWCFASRGIQMVEKPIQNSAGGLGIRLTNGSPQDGSYLEDYLPGYRSIGLQFFVYDEAEFICANEMLYSPHGERKFTFHSQINVEKDELPQTLMDDCLNLSEYLLGKGYKGLINIDALMGDNGHCLLEVNPRGSAFMPAFFAASFLGWTRFITHMKHSCSVETQGTIKFPPHSPLAKGGKGDFHIKKETLDGEEKEIVLLDFGRSKKVVRRL